MQPLVMDLSTLLVHCGVAIILVSLFLPLLKQLFFASPSLPRNGTGSHTYCSQTGLRCNSIATTSPDRA